jgi:general secretion pathway protein G
VGAELKDLAAALHAYEGRKGRYPTTEEGLAALAGEPNLLDDLLGEVPKDAWGRAYDYRLGSPQDASTFVLRSLGPDGEIDTEDDVFPE